MIKNIGVNNTLTKLSNTKLCIETTEEVQNMYRNVNKKRTWKVKNFTRNYGKQSNEQKFETAFLKLTQERSQIKEYRVSGAEFSAVRLYYSNRIF